MESGDKSTNPLSDSTVRWPTPSQQSSNRWPTRENNSTVPSMAQLTSYWQNRQESEGRQSTMEERLLGFSGQSSNPIYLTPLSNFAFEWTKSQLQSARGESPPALGWQQTYTPINYFMCSGRLFTPEQLLNEIAGGCTFQECGHLRGEDAVKKEPAATSCECVWLITQLIMMAVFSRGR